ncbi:class I SAM-dependent methyltransferase [Pelotomaculum isophthalicicum JI]|uniref:Class I SAM-dependent methyltransferase n=1 Tax=Pelotomaculum isophthalicicum JI TaxID=947010 RepID=A0A9X4GZT2_9FIRM|nr:class I SAM-dependent methyltransferase [Pelotomaculum isophthalicicum]MDF9409142.1 class I SAM-dependent methyltransferase [Pelotomaculum isophthalicicum JI]
MNLNEKQELNKKLENIFLNYYKNTGFFNQEKHDITYYKNRFLRERFVERILFTVMTEFNIGSLSSKSVLIVGLSHELASFFMKLGSESQNITLADVSAKALERTKDMFSNHLEFVKIDLDRLCFEEDTFDVIICFNYLSNIPVDGVIRTLAGEINRILKPGGIAFVSFTNEISSHDDIKMSGVMRTFRKEEILQYFEEFKLVNVLHFLPYNFLLFSINEEHIFPKKIGTIEDILIEKNERYTDSILLLTK